jgi:hypothetical protein
MKNLIQILAGLFLIGLTFTACQKDSDIQEENAQTSEDIAMAQTLMEETEDAIDYELETRGDEPETDCPTVTVTPNDGSYPRTVTIDFGAECEGPYGHTRSGIIQVVVTDTMKNAGASRTVTFDNYFVDGVQVEGTRILTNEGPNADGQLTFIREANDMLLTFPNGDEVSWNSSQTITQIEGGDTPAFWDNVIQIEGSTTGINRAGNAFTSTITEPLIKPRTCRWVVSGVREITVNDSTRTLDFGDGNCDRFATVTLPNGVTKQVIIRRWW